MDERALVRIPLIETSPLDRYRLDGAARRRVDERFVLIDEGRPGPDANYALLFAPISPAEFFETVDGFFGSRDVAIIVESETAAPVEAYLREQGWIMDEEETAMLLAPIPDAPPPPAELTIELVTTARSYEEYMTVVPGNRDWVPSLEAATDPRVALLAGYVAGRPVATARLTCYGAIGEVTAVQTLEEFRRRGIGTAMTWAALAEGKRRGCRTMTLTSTPMGYSVYLRMGFAPICSYRTYLPA